MASGKGPLTRAGKAPLWPCPSGAEPQGYVENAERRSTMNASVPLLAVMLSSAALATTACNPSTETQTPKALAHRLTARAGVTNPATAQ